MWMWLLNQGVSKTYRNGATSENLAIQYRILGKIQTSEDPWVSCVLKPKVNVPCLRGSEPLSSSVSYGRSHTNTTSAALSKMIKISLSPKRAKGHIHPF